MPSFLPVRVVLATALLIGGVAQATDSVHQLSEPAATCGLDSVNALPLPSPCDEAASGLAECDICCGADSWSVLVGGAFYARENGARTVFVDAGGDPVFSPGAGFQAGIVANVVRHRTNGYDYDFGLMWITSGNNIGLGILPPGSNIPASPIVFNDTAFAASVYATGLFGLEWNRRFGANDDVQFLAGLRYINLSERLIVGAVNADPEVFAGLSQTGNNLLGFQVGGDAKLWSNGNWDINGVVKAGLYYNDAQVNVTGVFLPGPIIGGGTENNGSLAFQGQAELAATWWFRENLALRLGYQALWFDGIALATNQFSAPNFNGAIFMHGGVIQAEYTW
jgi:hypothetical protein